MQGVSGGGGLFADSGDGGVPEGGTAGAGESAAPGSSSDGAADGDRNFFSGNRWPRQETLALLKIRSDMDVVFRDSNHKGPLWEEVSRKLSEMGYLRSAKKCKEKFENVYKYHKRTKEGRASKPDGKAYRFFDQLEALEGPQPSQAPPPASYSFLPPPNLPHATAPSPPNPTAGNVNPSLPQPHIFIPPQAPFPLPSSSRQVYSTDSSSSSTSSDREIRRKKKRKWKEFFDKLLKEVVDKQEELQRKFLEAIEKREQERLIREEAWKMQEIARLNREHEILVQERSLAAAKDAAVIAFLQKMTAGSAGQPVNIPDNQPEKPPEPPPVATSTAIILRTSDVGTTSSRWPKPEVQALISLRTGLDTKYQETGPKGPLWEEISTGMRRLGYNRSAKRCKEKWENINKYFKKVKESNKKRPEDSKTCPYFHQLDELYRDKTRTDNPAMALPPPNPLPARPEQQWPLLVRPPDDVGDAAHFDEEDDDEEEDSYDVVTDHPTEGGACR